ncbi:unnamed protein product [Urochloa decumbens]|uniref:F-box domain-containing protein n=1 Tax=Urochloa decumbens TaxID=240449 RepID=A0ABC8Y442_9POAL
MDSTTQSAYDEWIARREAHIRLCAAGGEDRLGELPDDILRLIIRRLDTRTALATAALSKRWARLPRELPVLEFKVGDVLPERYRRYLRRRADAVAGRGQHDSVVKNMDKLIGRCERRGMRSLASAVTSFLDAADDYDGNGGEAPPRRSAQALTLELLPTHNFAPFNRLIAKAVADWGVQDLSIIVPKTPCQHRDGVSYTFPHPCFVQGSKSPCCSGGGSLNRLRLSNCAPLDASRNGRVPPAAFSSLTVLVLQDMPRAIRGRVYERVIQACPVLEVLHLKSCLSRGRISLDMQMSSRMKELVIDTCTFRSIALRSLPKLERMACQGAPLSLQFGHLPLLTHLNLSFYDDPNAGPDPQYAAFFGARDEYSALNFSSRFSSLENLVVRFTGPEMWIVAPELRVPFGNLRRLLVADMPRSWDISWTCRLLEAAPFLDTLHVHVADDNSWETAFGPAIPEPPSCFKHHALREVVILGFQGTGTTQLHFVRFLRDACKALKNVALLKRGYIQGEGLWNWEVVASTVECQWSDEERDVLLREINGGTNNIASSTTQIVLR